MSFKSLIFIGLCKTIKSFPYYRVCNAILAFIFVVIGVILRWRFLKKAAAGSPLAKIFAVLLFWVNLLFYVYVGLCICRNIQVIINENVTTEQKNILEKRKYESLFLNNYVWEAQPIWKLNICVLPLTVKMRYWFYVLEKFKKWFWKFKNIRKYFNIFVFFKVTSSIFYTYFIEYFCLRLSMQ